jgi:hypothetical protein
MSHTTYPLIDPHGHRLILLRLFDNGDQTYSLSAATAGSTLLEGSGLALNNSSLAVPVPAGANAAVLQSEHGPLYYEINSEEDASENSAGYCPADCERHIFKLAALHSLKIFGAAGVKAHIQFYAVP